MTGAPIYQLVASFDTETTNYTYKDSANKTIHCAWCILYTFEDIRKIGIRKYTLGKGDINYFRNEDEALSYIDSLIEWGENRNVIPIIAGYNLMFDLQTLMESLNKKYFITAVAQSATNAYCVDLHNSEDSKLPLLRFWDTFHLEMRGLSAMGETAGVPKLYGDWDYSKIRTNTTPLTDKELEYAAYDVHIIPSYLRYLLESNEWLKPTDFGTIVMTKTSIVRTYAARNIGNLKYIAKNGKKVSLSSAFMQTCATEYWKDYSQYALQRACFRGGFTFTSANLASREFNNIYSLDETSAHHFLINGRKIPTDFRNVSNTFLNNAVNNIINVSRETVLKRYDHPWLFGIHALIKFTNIRLKKGSAFEKFGIALIPQSKFAVYSPKRTLDTVPDSPRSAEADADIALNGYRDRAIEPVFAFSKLMNAKEACIFCTECELYAISRVYDFDKIEVIKGEASFSWIMPPDYVTLQSNILFSQKQEMKKIIKNYKEGEPYTNEIDKCIPQAIIGGCKKGTITTDFLNSYYQSTVKGMFNGIYGVQSQNVLRPDYEVINGDLEINQNTKVNAENFEERSPKRKKVLYTYGMRIVGGSRLQLVLAIELLYEKLGNNIHILGGDTDSLKVACSNNISANDLINSLCSLHKATRIAINNTQKRVNKCFPTYCVNLKGVGEFEVENEKPYESHVELWNKSRVTFDGKHCHVTCAGLSRPRGLYNIENALDDCLNYGMSLKEACDLCLGYNTYIDNSISHALERTHPRACDRVALHVKDYLGNETDINLHAAIALYPSARNIADTTKRSNYYNVKWLENKKIKINIADKIISYKDNYLIIQKMTVNGWEEIKIPHKEQ